MQSNWKGKDGLDMTHEEAIAYENWCIDNPEPPQGLSAGAGGYTEWLEKNIAKYKLLEYARKTEGLTVLELWAMGKREAFEDALKMYKHSV